MKTALSLLAIGLALSFTTAQAQTQQTKMKTCNAQAKDKKGDERKAFMKECLSAKDEAKPAAALDKPEKSDKPMTQGQKLGACAKEASAKGLKGDEANKFKSECAKAK